MCERLRSHPHALPQWRAITALVPTSVDVAHLPRFSAGLQDEMSLQEGQLGAAALATLLDVLALFTVQWGCGHAVWEDYGWLTGARCFVVAYPDSIGRRCPEAGGCHCLDSSIRGTDAQVAASPGRLHG